MSAVVEAVGGVVSDVVEFVGDVGETVVQAAGDVVETVGDVAQGVVQGAIDDPLGTIAKVGTAIYAPYLLPVVSAGVVVANGGDIEDALISGAVSYIAPEIGEFVGSEVADSVVGELLGEAAQATGIEALPQIATRGIGQAAAGTAAGIAQGQDIGEALTRGLSSGIGSTVGGIAGSEVDTGSDIADRLIGRTIAGGTTAALRGKDFETGATGALSSGLFQTAVNEGIKGLKSFEMPTGEELPTSTESVSGQPLIADTGTTATDVELTPVEQSIKQMLTGYETEEDKANLESLIESLYPETRAEDVTKFDEFGNAYDSSGQIIGNAEDFGLVRGADAMGNPAWITPAGETISTSDAPQSTFEPESLDSAQAPQTISPSAVYDTDATAIDVSEMLGGGEMEGDYPEKIINNPDGSTTVIEFDGTQRIFNIDGSVTTINPEGMEEEPQPEEEPAAETATSEDSSLNLNNLANALLGTASSGGSSGGTRTRTRTVRGGGSGIPLGAMAGIAGGIIGGIDAANQPTQGTGMGGVSPYGFNWQTGEYMNPMNAVAYGQDFVTPEYTRAAQGGLMSVAPQYIQPTVPNNGLTFKQPVDPSSSVYMYARGGLSSLGHYSDGGRMLKGPGDGMSDDIPATIAGRQPARLANEEFVIPADVVSHLGNGSSEAGAKVLYDMMARVRKARTGTSRQGKQIKPQKYLPK